MAMLLLITHTLLMVLGVMGAAGAERVLDPGCEARAIASRILNDTADAPEFEAWGYGQSIGLGALIDLASATEVGRRFV